MNQMLIKVFIGIVVFSPSLFGQEFLVVDPDNPTGGVNVSQDYIVTYGYQFTVGASPLEVLSLGVWNSSGNGLSSSHDVGIWDSQGDLLTSATVFAGSSTNTFLYSPMTPIVLDANQSYIIGATYINGDVIGLSDTFFNNSIPIYNSTITFDVGIYGSSLTGLTFPNITDFSDTLGVFGPNAEIEVVPEPSSVRVLLLGTLLMALSALKKPFRGLFVLHNEVHLPPSQNAFKP